MLNKRNLLLTLLLLFGLNSYANFDFNANCIKAYKEVTSLRLSSARALIDAEKKRNPQNSIPYLLDNYIDYFTIMLSENKGDFDRLKNNKDSRLARIAADDKNSPWYLYAQADIQLQWSLLHGFFQEYLSSSMAVNKAYKMLQENTKKYPAFLPNQKDLGMVNAVLGSLPDAVKRTISMLGVRGNTQTGVQMLENLLETLPHSSYAHFYDEVLYCLTSVKMDVQNDYGAYAEIISNTQRIDSSSLLRTYIKGYSAIRSSHTTDAIAFLAERPAGKEYPAYPYLDYLAGIARMRKLDTNAAKFLTGYIQHTRSIAYVKDAYLNLAWLALLRGDRNSYNSYIEQVKAKGNSFHEKDKQAITEANDPVPDVNLLRARLLFDGGYYDRALEAIDDKRSSDYKLLRDKIEYCYRLGRIYDETGKDDAAIKFYQFAIDLGKKERYFFASNAALRIGAIYEKRKNLIQARNFYNIVLDMSGHDYERSIESKAKAGLKRTGG